MIKQSTAVTKLIGPFVDDTDGKTAETALTIAQADIRLSKNGGAFAQSANIAGATHDENGYYGVPLDTTDSATLGSLKVCISKAGALPVWAEYMVVPAAVYDSLVLGTDYLPADAVQISGDSAAADNLEAAADGTGYNLGGGSVVAASVTGAVGSVTGAVGSVTGNIGGNLAGSVGSVTGAVGSVTGNIGGNLAGSVGSVTGAVGSVAGAVGSVTGAVGSVTADVTTDAASRTASKADVSTLATATNVTDAVTTIRGAAGTETLDTLAADIAGISAGSAPTVEQIDTKLTAEHGAGLWTSAATGSGDIYVTAATLDDTGDDMTFKTAGGAGIGGAVVKAFVTAEYTAGTFTVRATTVTVDSGAWLAALMLNAGIQYTIEFTKDGYTTATTTVTPSA